MGRKIHNGRGRTPINFNIEKVKDVVTKDKPACTHRDQALTRYSSLSKVQVAIQQLPTLDEYETATWEWCQPCQGYYIKNSTVNDTDKEARTYVQQ